MRPLRRLRVVCNALLSVDQPNWYRWRALTTFHGLVQGSAVRNIDERATAAERWQGGDSAPFSLRAKQQANRSLDQFGHRAALTCGLALEFRHDGVVDIEGTLHVENRTIGYGHMAGAGFARLRHKILGKKRAGSMTVKCPAKSVLSTIRAARVVPTSATGGIGDRAIQCQKTPAGRHWFSLRGMRSNPPHIDLAGRAGNVRKVIVQLHLEPHGRAPAKGF